MKFIIAVLATTLLASAPATASDDGGFYVGAGMGSFGIDSSIDDTFSFNADDTAFKLLAGYDFNAYFAAELEYIDGGKANEFFDDGEGGTIDVGISVTGFNAGIVGTAPIGEKFRLFAKLGMIFWDADFSASGGGISDSDSMSGEDLSWGVGAGFDFTENFGARIEYQGFEISDADTVDMISASVTWRF